MILNIETLTYLNNSMHRYIEIKKNMWLFDSRQFFCSL